MVEFCHWKLSFLAVALMKTSAKQISLTDWNLRYGKMEATIKIFWTCQYTGEMIIQDEERRKTSKAKQTAYSNGFLRCTDSIVLNSHLDTSLINVDVHPTYVTVEVKEKLLQLRLSHEVLPHASVVQRSRTTGKLLITMPRVSQSKFRTVRVPVERSTMQVSLITLTAFLSVT